MNRTHIMQQTIAILAVTGALAVAPVGFGRGRRAAEFTHPRVP